MNATPTAIYDDYYVLNDPNFDDDDSNYSGKPFNYPFS